MYVCAAADAGCDGHECGLHGRDGGRRGPGKPPVDPGAARRLAPTVEDAGGWVWVGGWGGGCGYVYT